MLTANVPAIVFEGVTKRFGKVRALQGIDLKVERGELFGFLGPNGAGKTTAIRLLLDLIRPNDGTVRVFGLDAQRDSLAVRRHIAYLPGDLRLYPRMTARDYFGLVEDVRGLPIDHEYRQRLVDVLRLDEGRRIGHLSRGNQQKIGVIAALMVQPDLLVLDEPTTGLDPLMQETVGELLREAVSDGCTVFLSSHVLSEVERMCGRVAMLREGVVVDTVDLVERLKLAPQRVVVEFAVPPTRADLEGIHSAALIAFDGVTATFELQGAVDHLIKWLSHHHVVRLETTAMALDEFFLAYYASGTAHGSAEEASIGRSTLAGGGG